MENRCLIDLSVKYGLNSSQLTKLTGVIYQAGVSDMNSKEFQRIATYICEMKLLAMPEEELMEELKRKGLIRA